VFRAVFFNLFATREPFAMFVLLMEPYAMIQVSILLQPQRTVVTNFISGNFSLFRLNLTATCGTPKKLL